MIYEYAFYVFIVGLAVMFFVAVLWVTLSDQKRKDYDPHLRYQLWSQYNLDFYEDEIMTKEEMNLLDQLEQDIEEQEAMIYQQWQEAEQKRREAQEQKKKEQEAIANDFPGWLVTFGDEFGITTYKGLTNLTLYLAAILSYAQENFDNTMPIKRTYLVIAEGEGFAHKAPNTLCTGRVFFERLSKFLARNGLLLEGRGTRGRTIAPNALAKLRPTSNNQRPNAQDDKILGSHDSEILKPDTTIHATGPTSPTD